MSETQHRVLVIDDDRLFLEIVQFHLERSDFLVDTVSDPRAGFNRAIEGRYDLILLDLMMPGMNGEEVLSLLKPFSGQHRVMVVSAHTDESYRARARDLGAAFYMSKPVDPDDLVRAVTDLVSGGDGADHVYTARSETPGPLDRLALWVFDNDEVSPGRGLPALGVILGIVGVMIWLVVF
jgi:DNA-binding response OmpR family regulator